MQVFMFLVAVGSAKELFWACTNAYNMKVYY